MFCFVDMDMNVSSFGAQKKAITQHQREVEAAETWCAGKGTIVLVGPDQNPALHAVAKPIVDHSFTSFR